MLKCTRGTLLYSTLYDDINVEEAKSAKCGKMTREEENRQKEGSLVEKYKQL